jgi:methionine synthase II (cobalamin-independent)
MSVPVTFHGPHLGLLSCNLLTQLPGENAYSKDVYANDEEHFNDIAAAYRVELGILYDAGCRNVQIDDPLLACTCST